MQKKKLLNVFAFNIKFEITEYRIQNKILISEILISLVN